jgi:hypothetical protein
MSGSIDSSNEYNNEKDGAAIINKRIAGIIVHTISNVAECVNFCALGFPSI